ncbi:NifQ protein, partial [Phaeovulum veldkampii DSM 11550]
CGISFSLRELRRVNNALICHPIPPSPTFSYNSLPDRARLSGLIAREFPRLFAANRHNLRWKRFFYRQICAGGSGLCPAPNCDDCPERSACLAPVAD